MMAATPSLVLRSDLLTVEVLPGKGADIVSFVDVASGVDVLFRSPWGRRDPARLPSTGDSRLDWLARYPGGWQQLVPNAGAPRVVDGVLRGYHGEAAVVGWDVESADQSRTSLSVQLVTAPLHLTRSLRLEGASLHVSDTVRNTSPDPVPVMWVQHPAFGAPFINERSTLTSGARGILTDADTPGNVLPPDIAAPFPATVGSDGSPLHLGELPGPGSGRALFAALTDFDSGWFAINSPSAGFGIRVDWDATAMPYAWFWQECNATSGFPWFRRAYVIAVEPANVLPGDPSPARPDRGSAPVLAPGASWNTELTVTRTEL
ncbi:aldose 1-epimerase [Actinoallomurus sp. NPDC050550]|uniref:aldose 1-epimerase n=1 Tax=Actinoallomurus sp. NPDC050550 TaxID=3154937 RepID=UPI0033ED87C6